MRRVVTTIFHVSHEAPRNLTFRALAMTPMTSSPPAATGGTGRKEESPPPEGAVLTAAPQPPQNFVVADIAAPQLPQNFPAGGAAGGAAGAEAAGRAATRGDPQIPQNFSDPEAGLPHEAQTYPPGTADCGGWRRCLVHRCRCRVRCRCCDRAVRDFHKTLAAEFVTRFDRVATCFADKPARCRCNWHRGCILRRRWWWRGLVGRSGSLVHRCRCCIRCRCCDRAVRDFHKTLAAEFVTRIDRVATCFADTADRCGCERGCVLRRRRWRGLIYRGGCLVHRCRCCIRCRWCLVYRCRARSRWSGCRGDIPGLCPADPTELLVRCKRCTAGTADESLRTAAPPGVLLLRTTLR